MPELTVQLYSVRDLALAELYCEAAENAAPHGIQVGYSTPFLPAGRGQVDLMAASRAAVHADYIAVELDSYPGDMMEAVAESYRYLTGNGIATGRK